MIDLGLTGTEEAILALVVVGVMFALFLREVFPTEVVAVTGAAAMLAMGLVPYDDARLVLANPAPWTIGAMFVVMGALVRTGALDWFTQAADSGVVSSAYNLGYLYDPTADDGLVAADRKDAARAYYWYRIAAKQGDEASRQEAELIAARLTPEKIAEIDSQVARWTPMPVSDSVNDGVRLPG